MTSQEIDIVLYINEQKQEEEQLLEDFEHAIDVKIENQKKNNKIISLLDLEDCYLTKEKKDELVSFLDLKDIRYQKFENEKKDNYSLIVNCKDVQNEKLRNEKNKIILYFIPLDLTIDFSEFSLVCYIIDGIKYYFYRHSPRKDRIKKCNEEKIEIRRVYNLFKNFLSKNNIFLNCFKENGPIFLRWIQFDPINFTKEKNYYIQLVINNTMISFYI